MATRTPPLQHTFFSEMKPIKEIEQGLNLLMKDFEEGKMQAFTDPDTISRMDRIRQMQERLAQKHFDQDKEMLSSQEEGKQEQYHRDPSKTEELMRELDALTSEIQQLKPISLLDTSYPTLVSSPLFTKTPEQIRSPVSPLIAPPGEEVAERVWEGSTNPTPDTVKLSGHVHESSLASASRHSQDDVIETSTEISEGDPLMRPANTSN